ncbi:MAG: GNAT family N-acetyltransferase [Tabrizicola sp.]|nr:GNAT family N-acetyltransferase [Tabrizicola sp.]
MLTTPRLTLRPVTPADRLDLIALEADPLVMHYLNGGRPTPEEGLTGDDYLTPRGSEPEVMAAHERATGQFIGWFAFFDDGMVDGTRTAELGYRLAREFWGKGYATEGVTVLIAQAFDHWGFGAVRANTMTVNAGSRRVMEKSGMTYLKTIHPVFSDPIPGAELGEVVYEIRKPLA